MFNSNINIESAPTIQPFKFWCQKVLPLVYDDSLSYYELLCKFVDYLNITTDAVNTANTNVSKLNKAYVKLEEYVNSYFDNLNIQNEINNKLDEMATNGELSSMVQPLVGTEVSKWLTENMKNPDSPPLDKTLTLENAAADAKVTGNYALSAFATKSENYSLLPNETDFNELKTPGNYRVSSTASMLTMTNRPGDGAGKLTVIQTANANNVFQLYISVNEPNIRVRNFSAEWTEWISFKRYDENDMQDSNNFTIIADNSDFNNISNPGMYRVISTSSANTMINIPVFNPGKLDVSNLNNTNNIVQIYYAATDYKFMYIRERNSGGTWTDWQNVLTNYSGYQSLLKSITTDNKQTIFDDCNDAPNNTVVNIMNNAQLLNSPPATNLIGLSTMNRGYVTGVLATFCGDREETARAKFQIACYHDPQFNLSIFYTRTAYRSSIKNEFTWYPWNTFGDTFSLHATNMILSANSVDTFFNNLNDAPLNSIIQLDKNLTEGTVLNNPAPGYSGLLVTLNFAGNNKHGCVQKVYSLQSGKCVEYFRYGYQNTSTEFKWTVWSKTLTE